MKIDKETGFQIPDEPIKTSNSIIETPENTDWMTQYPLNTFQGETYRELVHFIFSLLAEQKDEILEKLPKLKNHLCRFNDGECECLCFKECLEKTKEIIKNI
jgi:hypothetical protein